MLTNAPIDVVIAWVDGHDPAHKRKMAPYLDAQKTVSEDRNAPTRFNSEGEIYYCVASIFRFAPFVRQIFIITDEQNPDLKDFIRLNFPSSSIPVVIIDHKVLFKGYEKHLPVFNSLSIETCLFRLPELSENFVYLNDDFFLVRPLKPTDWFIRHQSVAYGHWRSVLLDSLLRTLKPKKNGVKPFGFKDSMINAAKQLNLKSCYFHIDHTPLAMKKSVLERYFERNPEQFIANISHKFRHNTQFNPQALFYMVALKNGESVAVSENKLLYMKPVNKGQAYIDRKMKTFREHANLLFCCIGSIDMATEETRNRLFDWLKNDVLKIKF